MTCTSCVARVKSELLKLGDVVSADVQLKAPQAVITMNKHIPVTTLQKAISNAGHYTISDAGDNKMHATMQADETTNEKPSYLPIFLLFGYITIASLLAQTGSDSFDWMLGMRYFMAGFFFVFSFFKLMNLKGFAEGYGTYDIVAKNIPAWGFIYPFVELGLGIAFFTGFMPLETNVLAFVVMSVSSIGVIQSLLRKTSFQCACLGTVIRLPLSKVTLFEDMLMIVMSAIMILSKL